MKNVEYIIFHIDRDLNYNGSKINESRWSVTGINYHN